MSRNHALSSWFGQSLRVCQEWTGSGLIMEDSTNMSANQFLSETGSLTCMVILSIVCGRQATAAENVSSSQTDHQTRRNPSFLLHSNETGLKTSLSLWKSMACRPSSFASRVQVPMTIHPSVVGPCK